LAVFDVDRRSVLGIVGQAVAAGWWRCGRR
jgi:hypothetical protein